MATIVQARSGADIARARELLEEYVRIVDAPECFTGYEDELAGLPGAYAPPAGRLYIALENGIATGCVALRGLDETTAEMKRLYVRAGARSEGLGRRLAIKAIDAARKIGYARVVLDTLPKMHEAALLYRSLRFQKIAPYLACPTPGAICYELRL
ncbi:MAG: GNAT family N-acetyltransferase [Burkholderiales bacterium]